MKKILFLFLFLISVINAQNDLRFDFDYAQFKFDTTSNYLEVYYSIVPSDFNLIEEDGVYIVKGKMHVQIQNKESNELVVNKDWGLTKELKDSLDYKTSQALLGVVGFKLKRGSYNIDISVEDMLGSREMSYSESIDIVPYYRSTISISDLEFANRILNENVNKNSIFYKNTLEVYPNPSVIFSQNSPVLFYYSELYELNTTTSKDLVLTKALFNSENLKVYESSKKISSFAESIVEVGIVNLKKYPTDSYTFILSISSPTTDEVYTTSKRLFLVNPTVASLAGSTKSGSNYVSSEFGVLSIKECDDLFEKSKIIATSEEVEQYSNLDSLSNKREYLFKFWKKRDKVPSTQVNEFKRMFLSRIDIANERYRTVTTQGFKTDRGRVFTRLGEPDEIERYPNETNSKPYEIWYYNQIEGGVYFVFGDYTGFNYYELLHSTMRGEMQDPNWARRLTTK